jgi:hypothetical protein
MDLPQDDIDKQKLIVELQQLGIKHTADKIICIGRTASGKIVFLKEGKAGQGGSGLAHILQRHEVDFGRRGISPTQISDLIITALTEGKLLGYQGVREPRREIYEIVFEGQVQQVAISVSNNGYIFPAI